MLVVSRTTLEGVGIADPDEPVDEWLTRAQAAVAAPVLRLRLVVDLPGHGWTAEGWADAETVVWHATGDRDTAREAFVGNPAHLAPTVARMLAVGPRAGDPRHELGTELAALRRSLATGVGDPIAVVRIWTLTLTDGPSSTGMTVVDGGPEGALWAVRGRDGTDHVRLSTVGAREVWNRIVASLPPRGLLVSP